METKVRTLNDPLINKDVKYVCFFCKFRYGICQKKACGESADVNEEDCNDWKINVLPKLLEKYEKHNVFNADETGLFFRCLPDKTLTFKKEKCHGGKHSKERVTCLFAANMDGSEKLKIVLIGKSEKPRCFRGIKWLPVQYLSNSKAWMTSIIFENWLITLDKMFTASGRKVLMLIDNCPAHPPGVGSKLKSIELKFFPPNMTSKLQPLDQGVIENIKCNYRRRILSKTINQIEEHQTHPKLTLLDCVEQITKAWEIDVKPETISNCFKKAGFGQHSLWEEEDDIPLVTIRENEVSARNRRDYDTTGLEDQYEKWLQLNNVTEDVPTFDDFVRVDSDIITSYFPTDELILEKYVNPSENETIESSDEDEESAHGQIEKPPIRQVSAAIETLRNFLRTEDDTPDELYGSLNNIEAFFETRCKEKRQTVITNYFSKTNVNMYE